MQPGTRLSEFCPQLSQDRAKAELVPVRPPLFTQKLTKAEHHATELGCGPRLVDAKYSLIRGSLRPSATPISRSAMGIQGNVEAPRADGWSGGGSPGNSAYRVKLPSSWGSCVNVPLSSAMVFAIICNAPGGTSVKTRLITARGPL